MTGKLQHCSMTDRGTWSWAGPCWRWVRPSSIVAGSSGPGGQREGKWLPPIGIPAAAGPQPLRQPLGAGAGTCGRRGWASARVWDQKDERVKEAAMPYKLGGPRFFGW